MTDITYKLQKTPQENVCMETAETLKAENYIKGKQKMLEWGSGGSTLYFPSLVKKYVSIEHDRFWYDKIKPDIKDNVEYYYVPPHEEKFDVDLDKEVADLIYAPLANDTKVRDGITYWNTRGNFDWHCGIDYIRKPLGLGYEYDIILIDGRCRIFCAYIALSMLKEDGYLLFHDFNNRTYYHGILKYYEIIDTAGTLAILTKRKKDIDKDTVKKISADLESDFNKGRL